MSRPTYVPPSTREKAFNCPHCGALAKQFWHQTLAQEMEADKLPIAFTEDEAKSFAKDIEQAEVRARLQKWAARMAKKLPFFNESRRDPYAYDLHNVSVSKCFNCDDIAIWIADTQIYPDVSDVVAPNSDLPEKAQRDYREAAAIVKRSPRGAAALLRLAIQETAIELGGSGRNLNDDIGLLVEKGLDPRVQQALDVVRVVGNNAVHPGELDIRDDTSTAQRLFSLVNLIADVMISQPKHIRALYDELPDGARKAVERRDKSLVNE